MMGNKGPISVVAVLLLMAGLMPLFTSVGGDGIPVRAPPLKVGLITSDETWDVDVLVKNVTVANGATITVGPDVTVYMEPNTKLFVEGKLIVEGTSEGRVLFRCSEAGNTWDAVQINSTGYTIIQNTTFIETDNTNTPFIHYGTASVFENFEVEGGFQGVYFQNPGGDIISGLKVYKATMYSLVLKNSLEPIIIRDLASENSSAGVFALESSKGCDIDRVTAYNHSLYFMKMWSSGPVRVNDFSFGNPSSNGGRLGVSLVGLCDLELSKGTFDQCESGFSYEGTMPGSKTNFTDVALLNTNNAIQATTDSTVDARFVDCDLTAMAKTAIMDGKTAAQRVDLINTTWNSGAPIDLLNDAYLNVSWYVDARIRNGVADPIDADLAYREAGSGPYTHLNSPTGDFNKLLFKDQTFSSSALPQITLWDFQFIPNDSPAQLTEVIGHHVDQYTFFDIGINLKPTNDMPASLDVKEDEWLEMDLYDHFFDPEGLDLDFDIETSDDIDLVQVGGPTSGTIRIKNSVDNWYGTVWANIIANDNAGQSISVNVTINVLPVNDAPYFIVPYPMRTIEEDTSTYFNFSGNVFDVEGDDIEITIIDGTVFTYEYNETTMNLTVWPVQDYFGFFNIEVKLYDGDAYNYEDLFVNVTSVNDLPSAEVRLENGSAAPYVLHSGSGLMVYELDLDEDTPVWFRIDALDVDSTNLSNTFVEGDLEHGDMELEAGSLTNYTYTPSLNDVEGDVVEFRVMDGIGYTSVWVWFVVNPMDDPVEFEPPSGWSITMDRYDGETIDLTSLITEVDGDVVTVTEPSDYVSVSGSVLSLYYDDTFVGDSETVTVTVSDGITEVSKDLIVNVNPLPELGDMKVTGEGDKWVVEVEGEEGAELWVVIEDSDGNTESYQMTYEDGKYTAEVPKGEAEKGDAIWISWTEGGDPVNEDYEEELPSVEGEKENNYLCCFILVGVTLIILILLFVLMVVIGAAARGRKGKKEEEE